MRPDICVRLVASTVAAMSLSMLGPSPATAVDPDSTDEPPTAAPSTPTPTPTEAPAPAKSEDVPSEETPAEEAPTVDIDPPQAEAEPDEVKVAEEPAEPEATGLLDLTILGTTVPIALPGLTLPLNLGWLDLNPQTAPATADPQFGGSASGLYAEALASDAIRVRTGQLGAVAMQPDGTPTDRTTAHVEVPSVEVPSPLPPIPIAGLAADGVRVRTSGGLTFPDKRPSATARTEIQNFSGNIYSANIIADGVHVSANAQRLADGQYQFTGRTKFAYLSIYGLVNWEDKEIEPNRTYDVAGLGKVVLNEQVLTQLPGDRQGIRVTGIHITLGTSKFGLPAGTDIYIGSAEAIIYE